ncbi:MAG: insulinase family protein, partial [Flavobacteriales bacterium]|nr:insulinase family protein [Flavobacteriales bacterium]
EKWFGPIPKREVPQRHLPKEPMQTKQKRLRVERNVPADLLLMAFHMPERSHSDYYAYDLLSDILSNGKSSLLYQRLVKEQKKFSDIGAYVMGSIDPGLIIISGRLNRSVSLQDGEAAVWDVLNEIKRTGIADTTLQKVKNRYETAEQLSLMTVLNKAMKLAFAAHLGDINLVNTESKLYRAVTTDAIQRVAKEAFRIENSTVLEYKAKPITA